MSTAASPWTRPTSTVTVDPSTKTYGDANPAFSLSYDTFLNGDDAADLGGAPVFVTSADETSPLGTYPVSVSGLTSADYDITYVDGELDVTARALTITADDQTKVYGDTFTFTGSEFTTVGLANSDTVDSVTLTSTGAPAPAAAGTYPIVASAAVGTGLDNYAITYTDGTLTVGNAGLVITADSTSKTYGDTVTFSGTEFTATGLTGGDSVTSVTLTSAGAVADGRRRGQPYAIVATDAVGSGLAQLHHQLCRRQPAVVTAALTVTVDPSTKTYGDANPAFSLSYDTFLNGDDAADLGGAPVFVTSADETSPLGTYPVSVSGLTSADYDITFVDGELDVTARALTITADDQTKVYGDTFTFTGSEFTTVGLANSDTVDSVTLTSTGAPAPAAAGTYPIVASAAVGTGLDNYAITYTDGTLTVNAKVLTVAAIRRPRSTATPTRA